MPAEACGAVGRWVQRAVNRVRLARWIGERAVQSIQQGVTTAWAQGATAPQTPTTAEGHTAASDPAQHQPPRVGVPPVAVTGDERGDASPGTIRGPADTSRPADVPDPADTFGSADPDEPFDGYDALPAVHIVARLARMSSTELLAIREYEAGRRARRTVISKTDQLLADPPVR